MVTYVEDEITKGGARMHVYMTSEISKYPEVTMVEILSRVSPKSLMRFKSVRKSWYALINNPNFVAKHVSVSRHNKLSTTILFKHFVLPNLNTDKKEMVLSLFSFCNDQDDNDDENLDSILEDLHIPRSMGLETRDRCFPNYRVVVSSHCDGIICLADPEIGISQNIVLCNPSIKEFKLLPKSPIALSPKCYFKHLMTVGFGCDLKSKMYKVVRMSHNTWEPFDDGGQPDATRHLDAEVYSLQTNSWKEIKNDNLIKEDTLVWPTLDASTMGIYCKGVLYWCGYEEKKDKIYVYTDDEEDYDGDEYPCEANKAVIMSFDIGAEEFMIISVPHDQHLQGGALGLWNDTIALCSRPGHWMSKSLDIWVLDEIYAWTKLLTIEESVMDVEPFPLTLFGNSSKQFVLVVMDRCVVIFYDIFTNKLKYLPLNGVFLEWSQAVGYVNSIVSLKGGSYISD